MINQPQPEATKRFPKSDYREYFRKNCYLPIIEHEQQTEPFGNVLNLSTSGLFVVTRGSKEQTDPLKAKFFVPNVPDPINFLGEVVYVKDEGNGRFRGMGVRFLELHTDQKKTLRSYVLNHGFNETLSDFQKKSNSSVQNLKPFCDLDAIAMIFRAASQRQAPIQIFWSGHFMMVMARLQEVGKYHLSLKLPDNSTQGGIGRYDHLYLGMTHQDMSYFFEATVKYTGNDSLTITKPDVIYFEERRVETRYYSESNGKNDRDNVELRLGEAGNECLTHQIVEFNSSGLSFHVPLYGGYFSPGEIIQQINIIKGQEIQRRENAKVVHVTPISENRVKVGLKFHVDRQPFELKRADADINDHNKAPFISQITQTAKIVLEAGENVLKRVLGIHPRIQLARYYNKKGEEIVAVVNTTFDIKKTDRKVSAPVVIIPPAFARRKETTGLLAMTIVETFKKYKQDVVVIRFDGIRCLGESYNDKECRTNGKEMVHYTLTQLADDIGTTVEYAKKNRAFFSSGIVIISFSMASVAARKAVLSDKGKDIRCWISCMGASDPDDLMKNSTGGIDYLTRFRQGEKLSVKQVLGHMVNLDNYCRDIELNNMADLEDARRDMAKLEIPITWIYGKFDYWINKNRIYDIMSIKSRGLRQVYEVPWGHIVRTSDEAIEVFKLITKCVWKQLYHSDVVPRIPSSVQRGVQEKAEWSRVRQKDIDFMDYWRTYLLGQEKEELGFDLISLTDEYIELMEKQVELLQIRDTDLVIDLGGGTGNFIQCYLEKGPISGPSVDPRRSAKIIMVDFVKEALLKARQKHKESIGAAGRSLSDLGYITADLDSVGRPLKLPFRDHSIDKILASLFISYIKTPKITLRECFRILKPGGKIVLSSLKPDTDMSKPIHALIEKIKTQDDLPHFKDKNKEELLIAVQHYINSAAYLTDLEEEKTFKFYNAEELSGLLKDSGFTHIQMFETFGNPRQGLIAIGYKA
jgi:ubiquinone/menaquinone biosynthesis C-methylase UbiE